MRSLVLVCALATLAHADATVEIEHTGAWTPLDERPLVVTIDGKRHSIAFGTRARIAIATGSTGRVVPIAVELPKRAPLRRWAALAAGERYTLRANPCSWWDLPTSATSDEPDRYRVDARALPASMFPLEVASITLARPGITEPFEVDKSAMCWRAGASIVVRSGKRVVFDQQVIGELGRTHTITLRPGGGYTIAVDP